MKGNAFAERLAAGLAAVAELSKSQAESREPMGMSTLRRRLALADATRDGVRAIQLGGISDAARHREGCRNGGSPWAS